MADNVTAKLNIHIKVGSIHHDHRAKFSGDFGSHAIAGTKVITYNGGSGVSLEHDEISDPQLIVIYNLDKNNWVDCNFNGNGWYFRLYPERIMLLMYESGDYSSFVLKTNDALTDASVEYLVVGD